MTRRRNKPLHIKHGDTSFRHINVNKKKDDRQATVRLHLQRSEKQGCFSTTMTTNLSLGHKSSNPAHPISKDPKTQAYLLQLRPTISIPKGTKGVFGWFASYYLALLAETREEGHAFGCWVSMHRFLRWQESALPQPESKLRSPGLAKVASPGQAK